jgi:hypothetical protein
LYLVSRILYFVTSCGSIAKRQEGQTDEGYQAGEEQGAALGGAYALELARADQVDGEQSRGSSHTQEDEDQSQLSLRHHMGCYYNTG